MNGKTSRIVMGLFSVLALAGTVHAEGRAIISEIMYNPDSSEGRWAVPDGHPGTPAANVVEWVELYNAGDATVQVGGWHLSDGDGETGPLPDDAAIEPGKAIVLIPSDQTVDEFRAAWGEGFDVYPVTGWGNDGITNLSNKPSHRNEILTLNDANGEPVDVVNYDDEDPWPSDEPDGPSIYLLPDKLDAEANDDGANWARSQVDVHGGRANEKTDSFAGDDVGSPGSVVTE